MENDKKLRVYRVSAFKDRTGTIDLPIYTEGSKMLNSMNSIADAISIDTFDLANIYLNGEAFTMIYCPFFHTLATTASTIDGRLKKQGDILLVKQTDRGTWRSLTAKEVRIVESCIQDGILCYSI